MFEKNSKTDRVTPKELTLGCDPFPRYQSLTSKPAAIDPLAATRISPDPPAHPTDVPQKEHNEEILDGRYRLEEKLGEGGMGTVYRAKHTLMDKTVAVKVIHQELTHYEAVAKRFEREAKSASRLTDPHCINVTDFGRTREGKLFLVMEYLQGETLTERLRSKGPLPFEKAAEIAVQILKALAHAHEAGVVHRDLKPDNVMLVTHGDDTDFVKVFDFGVAKLACADGSDENLTQAGLVLGTPAYLSPEQGKGKTTDHRADLYAVGVILFEMLAGFRPFKGASAVDVVLAHLNAPIPALPRSCNAPKAVFGIIKKSLAKNPEDRFDSAAQFIAALDELGRSSGQILLNSMLFERLLFPFRSASAQLISRRLHRIPTSIRQMLEQLEASTPDRISQPFKGSPVPITPQKKRLLLAGALALFLAFIFLAIAIWKTRDARRFQAVDAAHAVDLSDVSDERLARILEATQSYLQAGDGKKASSSARKALRLHPEQALPHLLLGHALYLRGDRLGATKSYARALELDRSLASNRHLREHLKEALAHGKPRQNAASILAEFWGVEGIEILTSLANSDTASVEERAVARQALIDTHNEDSIDWVSSLSADFRQYDSCGKKREVLAQMVETGNPGFLPFLKDEIKRHEHVQSGSPSDDSNPGAGRSREDKQPRCAIEDDLRRAYRGLNGEETSSP